MKHSKFLAALLLACTAFAVQAEDYPQRPIRVVVGYTAGGATDTIARVVADKISGPLGQPVIIENRPGASGNIALNYVAHAKPDGYTLHASGSPLVVSPALFKSLPFDSLKDFDPITVAVVSPNVLVVGKDFPANTIQELFELGKKQPGRLTYAGSTPLFVLAAEGINMRTGMKMQQIPYKGSSDALIDVSQGRVDVMIDTIGNQMQHIKAGIVKPLAVLGKQRSASLPDVPTLDESGLNGYEEDGWIGFVAPAGVPRSIIDRLNKEIVAALQSDEVRQRLDGMGFVTTTSTPEETRARVESDVDRYIKAADAANLPKM